MGQLQTIDVTGLPGPVVEGLQRLVDGLRAALPAGQPHASQMTPEQRVAAWQAFVARHRDVTAVADDSRESIYEGR
jgi:hypothetical protein